MKITLRMRSISDAIGLILLLFSLTFILPIIVGLVYSENIFSIIASYLFPMVITANIGLILWLAGNVGGIREKR